MTRVFLLALLLLAARSSYADSLLLPTDPPGIKDIIASIDPAFPASDFCRRAKDVVTTARAGDDEWAKVTVWDKRICTTPGFDDDAYFAVVKRAAGGPWAVVCKEQRGDMPDWEYFRKNCGGMPKAAYATIFRVTVGPDKPANPPATPGPGASREEYLAYLVKLSREHLNLLPPSVVGNRQGITTLSVLLKKDGGIVRISVATSSGYPDIDSSIEHMVAAVGRFPPLPSWYSGQTMDLRFQLKFPDGLKPSKLTEQRQLSTLPGPITTPVSQHHDAPPKTAEEIATYCKDVGTSGPSGEGNNYPGTENVVWRCANKGVYICGLGATGRQCDKLNTSVIPNDPIRDFCRKNPNASIVPMAVAGDYAATWKCQGTNPAVWAADNVDSQGYVTSAWSKVSITNPPDKEARAFVSGLYTNIYTVGNWKKSLDPDTLALLATNRKLLNGDLGALDYNPLCQCQDPGGLKAIITSLQLTGLETGVADIDLQFPDNTHNSVRLFLLRGKEGWKVRNIASKKAPSLWDMIVAENKSLTQKQVTSVASPDMNKPLPPPPSVGTGSQISLSPRPPSSSDAAPSPQTGPQSESQSDAEEVALAQPAFTSPIILQIGPDAFTQIPRIEAKRGVYSTGPFAQSMTDDFRPCALDSKPYVTQPGWDVYLKISLNSGNVSPNALMLWLLGSGVFELREFKLKSFVGGPIQWHIGTFDCPIFNMKVIGELRKAGPQIVVGASHSGAFLIEVSYVTQNTDQIINTIN